MFPILTEIKDYLVYNIELVIIVIIPVATLITFIGHRISKRIDSIEQTTCTDIDNRINLVNEKIDNIKSDIKELKQAVKELEELKVIKGVLDKMKYW